MSAVCIQSKVLGITRCSELLAPGRSNTADFIGHIVERAALSAIQGERVAGNRLAVIHGQRDFQLGHVVVPEFQRRGLCFHVA